MNTQSQKDVTAEERRLKKLDIAFEAAMFDTLSTEAGRTVVASVVRGSHNLHNCYAPGMAFDHVAYELGKQYEARELIGRIRRTRRCSDLFNLALEEYDNEHCRNSTSTSIDAASTGTE